MEVWKVRPGEVDHEIDLARLVDLPVQLPDAPTASACEAIYRRYVEPATGGLIPRAAFCDVPRATFLDFLGRHRRVLMVGDGAGAVSELRPIVVSQSLLGWDRPRHVAFRRGVEAMLPAILDRERLARLGHPGVSQVTYPFAHPESPSEAFYCGIDYRALPEAPWKSGVVSLYRTSDFPHDLWTRPFLSPCPIRPLAHVAVEPSDWPLLERVESVDHAAQGARMREAFRGFPWCDDEKIHPGRWRREPAERMRRDLQDYPDEPADLARMGRLVGLSPSTALRTFRAVFGQSPREFSMRSRVGRVKALLRQGRPIGEAAAETGFCDQSHLTAAFRRVVGMTPGAYLRAQESPIL